MGYLDGFLVTLQAAPPVRRRARHHARTRVAASPRRGKERRPSAPATRRSPSPSACTVATSSTATRTAWRSASAASCAPASARPSASTCAAPTTTRSDPTSPGERFGFVYEINYLRCIHCDLCVEACPTEAITESKLFEFSFTNRRDAIYTKAELVVGDDGKPQHLPWEDWRDGEDVHTSGWMRATVARRRRRLRRRGRLERRARLRRPRRRSPSRSRTPADDAAKTVKSVQR